MKACFIIISAVFALWAAPASAELTMTPLRTVISDDDRTQAFIVSNPTARIIEARASWVDLAPTNTGYRDATKAERQRISAAPLLTLSPAHFRLEPGGRIEVHVALRPGATFPEGEKRSHLLIETTPARTLLRKASDTGLQVDIRAGMSVPVIVRGKGVHEAAAKIGKTRLLRDTEGLLLLSSEISLQSDHSAYGRVTAEFFPEDDETSNEILARIDNISVYPDGDTRKIDLPLGYFSLGRGHLVLNFSGAGEYEGRVFDTRRFDISPPEAD